MEKLIELRVYLRDLTTHTAIGNFNQIDWVDQYATQRTAALDMWASTLGGTIMLSGTPEGGRMTVYRRPGDPHPILDSEWWTEVVEPNQPSSSS